jgi:hypothetical protein
MNTKIQNKKDIHKKKKKIEEYSYIQNDETAIKAGLKLIWLWVVIIEPPIDKEILGITTSKEQKICL